MDNENPETYRKMFERCFDLVAKVTGQPTRWAYLHGSGLEAVLSDMDSKQVPGKKAILNRLIV